MITRGIITYSDTQHTRVYLPILNGLVEKEYLGDVGSKKGYLGDPVVSISATPGIEVAYNVGDTVLIGFEDNDFSRPVILGHLKSSINQETQKPSINILDLTVKGNLTATTEVAFGDNIINFNDIFNNIVNDNTLIIDYI